MHKSLTLLFAGAIALGRLQPLRPERRRREGKDVFDSNCSVCHSSDSAGVKMGPGLQRDSSRKAKMSTTGKAPTDANVLEKINAGGNGMPSYKDILSAEEEADVIAFLKTL